MKEQIQKIMKDMAVANDEEYLLDVNTLYKCFDDNVSNNLVYGQMRVFKYLFCVIVCHCIDNALTDKDKEILKFYSEFVRDEKYVNGSRKALDYSVVKSVYDNYASKLNNELIERLHDNIKHQFRPMPTHVCPEHVKQIVSAAVKEAAKHRDASHYANAIEAMKQANKEHNPSCNRHWYTDGVTNVFEYECPEGFKPGVTQSSPSKARGKSWYNNGVTNVMTFECPEGFVPGMIVTKECPTRGKNWYNNGVKNVMEYECPEGFVPGRLPRRKCTHQIVSNTRDRKWFNNGIKNVMALECPEGFVPGRLYKRKK